MNSESTPLISICIATFNRASHLETCLNSIYNQIGDDSLFETIVCDNASEDNTRDLVKKFSDIYKSLTYCRNDTNIGAERNFLKAAGIAKGEYIFFHGDDDYFREGILYLISNAINENRNIGLYFLDALRGNGQSSFSSGMNNYLKDTSIYSTFISSVIIKKSEFERIPEPEKFISSNLFQVYLQYSVLVNNPDYGIIKCIAFWHRNRAPGSFNLAEVFIKNYIDILTFFTDKGLGIDAIRKDKALMLNSLIFPWYERIMRGRESLDVSNFSEIFTECYKDEPYFQDAMKTVERLKELGRSDV